MINPLYFKKYGRDWLISDDSKNWFECIVEFNHIRAGIPVNPKEFAVSGCALRESENPITQLICTERHLQDTQKELEVSNKIYRKILSDIYEKNSSSY